MAKSIRNFITASFPSFFTKWLEDFLILTGTGLIIINTYLISSIQTSTLSGNYLLGFVLIFIGVILAKR